MDPSSPRRALVTGAGGFVGANLVRRLVGDGHSVVAVVSSVGSDRWRFEGIEEEVEVVACDLRDGAAVDAAAAAARTDWVFHLAAHGAYSWETDAARIEATNVEATKNLLAACADVSAFVHAGSSSEYGLKDHPAREDEEISPAGDYALSKAAATALVSEAGRVTLRLYSAYGPWEEPGRLMPALVEHALRGALPPLVSPDTARDYVWVGDVCDAFVAAAEAPAPAGAVLNVCSGGQTTMRELVAVARERLGIEAEPNWGSMEGRSWDTSTWVGDPAFTRETLGWTATTPLGEGLAKMSAWMRETGLATSRYCG